MGIGLSGVIFIITVLKAIRNAQKLVCYYCRVHNSNLSTPKVAMGIVCEMWHEFQRLSLKAKLFPIRPSRKSFKLLELPSGVFDD